MVFKSDKSGHLTVDSVEKYSNKLKKHMDNDTIISRDDLKKEEENFKEGN